MGFSPDRRETTLIAPIARDPYENCGLALRYGAERRDGLRYERLCEERLFPACAPGFVGRKRLREPSDLTRVPVLADLNHPWSLWLEGVGMGGLKLREASAYSDSSVALGAALEGLGVVLARATLVGRLLAEGRLVRLFERDVPSPRAYFVVYSPAVEEDARIVAFKSWIFEEMALDQGPRRARHATKQASMAARNRRKRAG